MGGDEPNDNIGQRDRYRGGFGEDGAGLRLRTAEHSDQLHQDCVRA